MDNKVLWNMDRVSQQVCSFVLPLLMSNLCALSNFTLTLTFLLKFQEVNGVKACLKISPISKSNAKCDKRQ